MKKRIGLIFLVLCCLLFLGGCNYIIELNKDAKVSYKSRIDDNTWQYVNTQDIISEDGETRTITFIFSKK